jgi:Fe-Mn family superoxide dismutase
MKLSGIIAIFATAAIFSTTSYGLSANYYESQLVNHTENKTKIMNEEPKKFVLPPLPYAFDALEPYIDKMTMEVHHGRHHQAFINNLNNAVAGTELEGRDILHILANVSKYPAAVRNNAGGHWNHDIFWQIMGPDGGGKPSGALLKAVEERFGSFDSFKEQFNQAAMSVFGSGWAWLIVDAEKKLQITTTPNQDNPLMDVAQKRGMPIFGLDVWEHAYYLKYQNRRVEYVANFWNVVNWKEVERRYHDAVK